jgi:nucleotide-binding universal stress UspA family protein
MIRNAFFSAQPAAKPAGPRYVIACIDCSEHAAKVISHAYAIGDALDAPVTLLQVLEVKQAQAFRPDPIEWDLCRREARSSLRHLAECAEPKPEAADIQLVEGQIADEIIRFTKGHRDNLLVLGTQGEHGADRQCIGGTVHSVLDRATDSILLVPVTATAEAPSYERIAVPLDGSCWAESVMPLAVRAARAANAELVLVHVVPAPELTAPRPFEPEDLELRRRVIERNELTARDYLDRLRRQLSAQGLRVRVVLKHGDNVRTTLGQIVAAEGADLVIMSARGQGGSHPTDVRYGNVTSYLMTHAMIPVLIARPQAAISDLDTVSTTASTAARQLSRMPMVAAA